VEDGTRRLAQIALLASYCALCRSKASGCKVPAHAIIRDRGNPVGEVVVWYVHHRGGIVISCFVPADAV
jgi:hypothetical protein